MNILKKEKNVRANTTRKTKKHRPRREKEAAMDLKQLF